MGSNGQLGTALSDLLEKQNIKFSAVDLPEFDITNDNMITRKIDEINPDVIINTAGYTNVKLTEVEFAKAIQINAVCLKKLSEICNQNNIHLCHISTDYVFDGIKKKPNLEKDLTNPLNCYGLSKELGEKVIRNYCNNFAIIRTAALYGRSKKKSENIVDKIIQYAKKNNEISLVDDEHTSPTSAEDLARQIFVILKNNVKGIVHATSEGECNWYEFGKCIFDFLKMKVKIHKVKSAEFSQELKKPLYSVLENAILKSLQINVMPHWKDSLKKYLENF